MSKPETKMSKCRYCRPSFDTSDGKTLYSYDNENYMISSSSFGQAPVNYTYDKNGNLLTEESESKTIKYAYNAENRMIYCEVTDRAEKTYAQTSYAYDAFGRRILVQDKGECALRTLYDGFTFDEIKASRKQGKACQLDEFESQENLSREETLDIIFNALKDRGFLAPLQDYEPINFWD